MTGSSAWTSPRSRSTVLHKAPCGGEGTAQTPRTGQNSGWKWSVATDARGIPIGWAIDGANRNDVKLLGPHPRRRRPSGLLDEIETLHLDRGYDYPKIRGQLAERGLDDLNIQRRTKPGDSGLPSSRSGSGCAGSSRAPTRG